MAGQRRIMIDGFNLALMRGTGVATYGHNLALAAQGLGDAVDGLYGLRAPAAPSLREIGFYEALGGDINKPRRWQFRGLRELRLALGGASARSIAPPGQGSVVAGQFSHRLPRFDRLFSVPDLFEMAHRNFRRYGRFTTVRVPDPPAVMHWTYPLPVRLAGARNIYTLHDLVPLRLPFASLDHKQRYYRLINRCVTGGDHICTVSEASRADIERMFPAAAGKITNTYQAVRLPGAIGALDDAEVEHTLRANFNLPFRGYFLFFGAIEPKKNVARLIEAYLSLATTTPLVLVGPRAWGSDAELQLLQKDELNPLKPMYRTIRRIDYLPRSLLMRLVRGARAVAFPSLYEGFGLPALEAMMLGTPVLTGNTSSMPEVVGTAALTVDPYDVAAIAAGLRALDADAALRARLAHEGAARARDFSMERYQQRLDAMYRTVTGR